MCSLFLLHCRAYLSSYMWQLATGDIGPRNALCWQTQLKPFLLYIIYKGKASLLPAHAQSYLHTHLLLNSRSHQHPFMPLFLQCKTSPRLILFTAIFLLMIYGLHLHLAYRQALRDKYTASTFDPAFEALLLQCLAHPPDAPTHERIKVVISARTDWTLLSAGWEGTTYNHNDTVIKQFHPIQSPFRNCLPINPDPASFLCPEYPTNDRGHLPTEIASSLLLRKHAGFLPVTDFLWASNPATSLLQWHVLVPLATGGNLNTLSHRLHASREDLPPRTLDLRFCASFNNLLRALTILHDLGYCHDDIEPGNIFLLNTSTLSSAAASSYSGRGDSWV